MTIASVAVRTNYPIDSGMTGSGPESSYKPGAVYVCSVAVDDSEMVKKRKKVREMGWTLNGDCSR